MEKFCQSCGMPLIPNGQDMRGTEGNASKSNTYCYMCYLNGKFTEPNMTMQEMIEKGQKGLEATPGNKFVKFIMKKSYPMMVKKLKRWQN